MVGPPQHVLGSYVWQVLGTLHVELLSQVHLVLQFLNRCLAQLDFIRFHGLPEHVSELVHAFACRGDCHPIEEAPGFEDVDVAGERVVVREVQCLRSLALAAPSPALPGDSVGIQDRRDRGVHLGCLDPLEYENACNECREQECDRRPRERVGVGLDPPKAGQPQADVNQSQGAQPFVHRLQPLRLVQAIRYSFDDAFGRVYGLPIL